jgi:hypothetical protein
MPMTSEPMQSLDALRAKLESAEREFASRATKVRALPLNHPDRAALERDCRSAASRVVAYQVAATIASMTRQGMSKREIAEAVTVIMKSEQNLWRALRPDARLFERPPDHRPPYGRRKVAASG